MESSFIQVILPLKIEWEPYYRVGGEGLFDAEAVTMPSIGDRVQVLFSGKFYYGVVSSVGVQPNLDPLRIDSVYELNTGLEKVSEQEIELWRFIAEYYLCTVGEVYKAAYPSSKSEAEILQMRLEQKAQQRAEQKKVKELQLCKSKITKLSTRLLSKQQDLAKNHTDAVRERLQKQANAIEKELSDAKARLALLSTQQATRGEVAGATTEATEPTITVSRVATVEAPQQATEMALGVVAELSAQIAQQATRGAVAGVATLSNPGSASTPLPQFKAKPQNIFNAGKPLLLQGGFERYEEYKNFATQTLSQGKSVLLLVSEIAIAKRLQTLMEQSFGSLLYTNHSQTTAHQKHIIAKALRSATPCIVLSTRSGIFFPFSNLGLIIIDGEESAFYKQSDSSPYYNGRDCAIVLGKIHGANLLLGSASPSLETILNVQTGKYLSCSTKETPAIRQNVYIIDTSAERRKNGMIGCLSRKLIKELEQAKGKMALIRGYEKEDELQSLLQKIFPSSILERLQLLSIAKASSMDLSSFGTIALLSAEALFKSEDFRSDERAFQFLEYLKQVCNHLIIQTCNSGHQVFTLNSTKVLLAERSQFSLPPYTRLIDLVFPTYLKSEDTRPSTLSHLLQGQGFTTSDALIRSDGKIFIRVSLERNSSLNSNKEAIRKSVESFCKKFKVIVRICVDPS